MVQPVRCIKFGEIVLDENRKTRLLCSLCHSDYDYLLEFQQHLEYCRSGTGTEGPSTQGIFGDNVSLVFPSTRKGNEEKQQLLARYNRNNKEYYIYKFNGIKRLNLPQQQQETGLPQLLPTKAATNSDDDFMDLIKIEEELLDPRWYTELSSNVIITETSSNAPATVQSQTPSYNELVEAVTPFVQFKENLKMSIDTSAKMAPALPPQQKQNQETTTTTKPKAIQILNGMKTARSPIKCGEQATAKSKRRNNNTGVKTYILRTPIPLTTTLCAPPKYNLKLPISSNSSIVQFPDGNNIKLSSVGSNHSAAKQMLNQNIISSNNNNINLPMQIVANKPQTSCSIRANDSNKTKLLVLKPVEQQHQLPQQRQHQATKSSSTSTCPQIISRTAAPIQANDLNKIAIHNNNNTGKLKRVHNLSASTQQPLPIMTAAPTEGVAIKKARACSPSSSSTLQTQEILSKLQTLGLQVRRKQPPIEQGAALVSSSAPSSYHDIEKEKTLQLLKKLQSKGMNVKLIQPTAKNTLPANLLQTTLGQPSNTASNAVVTEKTPRPPYPLRRTLIIKKLS